MIRIVSDSSHLFKNIRCAELHCKLMIVTINGKTYREYEDINTGESINIINEGHTFQFPSQT